MLKQKPNFTAFWMPLVAVSFAHLLFPSVAGADPLNNNPFQTDSLSLLDQTPATLTPVIKPIAPTAKVAKKRKTAAHPAVVARQSADVGNGDLAPAPAAAPAPVAAPAPAPKTEAAGFLSLDQVKKLIPDMEITSSGAVLTIHGMIPAQCEDSLAIHNTINDTTINAGAGIGGIAFYNNGGLQACIQSAGVCKNGQTSDGKLCDMLSARSDAKIRLPDQTMTYGYLNYAYRDAATNADLQGELFHATSSADNKANATSVVEAAFKSCLTAGNLNAANSILNNNASLLGDVMDNLKDDVATKEKAQANKDADALVKSINSASEKDDFDYDAANDKIFAFLDDHPEMGDKFAKLIINLAGAHTKDGNPSSDDVDAAKTRLEQALDEGSNYTFSDKNRADLETALNKGIPRAQDRVTYMKDYELAQKGNPTALMKFATDYSKKVTKLAEEYQKKCVSSSDSKTSAKACDDMATELQDMESMPQSVQQAAQQDTIAQQQAMAAIFSAPQQTQQTVSMFGVGGQTNQMNQMCMYNPTACMTMGQQQIVNPYSQMSTGINTASTGSFTPGLNSTGTVMPTMYQMPGMGGLSH